MIQSAHTHHMRGHTIWEYTPYYRQSRATQHRHPRQYPHTTHIHPMIQKTHTHTHPHTHTHIHTHTIREHNICTAVFACVHACTPPFITPPPITPHMILSTHTHHMRAHTIRKHAQYNREPLTKKHMHLHPYYYTTHPHPNIQITHTHPHPIIQITHTHQSRADSLCLSLALSLSFPPSLALAYAHTHHMIKSHGLKGTGIHPLIITLHTPTLSSR